MLQRTGRGLLLRLTFVGVLALVSAVLLELTLALIRNNRTVATTPPFAAVARELYYVLDRTTIQFTPGCGRGDPELSYTLRPGRCVFSKVEFSTPVRVNRLGVRDDEASLDAPEIVVLGDSYAMGWGVPQEESFPSRLEALTGRKVLDTGISSYGTARELTLLKRVDLSRTRVLILQYYFNDREENETFIRQGYRLARRSGDWYPRFADEYRRGIRYWPGRYSVDALRLLAHGVHVALIPSARHREEEPETSLDGERREMQVLADVLAHSPVDLARFHVIVFEFVHHGLRRPRTMPLLRQALAQRADRERLATISVVDIMQTLGPDDFYRVDGHLNASGHAKVARILANLVR